MPWRVTVHEGQPHPLLRDKSPLSRRSLGYRLAGRCFQHRSDRIARHPSKERAACTGSLRQLPSTHTGVFRPMEPRPQKRHLSPPLRGRRPPISAREKENRLRINLVRTRQPLRVACACGLSLPQSGGRRHRRSTVATRMAQLGRAQCCGLRLRNNTCVHALHRARRKTQWWSDANFCYESLSIAQTNESVAQVPSVPRKKISPARSNPLRQ